MVYCDANGRIYFVHRAMDACFEVIRRNSLLTYSKTDKLAEHCTWSAAQKYLDCLAERDYLVPWPRMAGRVA